MGHRLLQVSLTYLRDLALQQMEFDDMSSFFSRNHKAVFTHHDSFFHAHFISDDLKVLGHIDETDFNSSKVTLKVSK